MSFFCSFLGCGSSSTPYDALDKDISDILSDSVDHNNEIFLDRFVQICVERGISQSDSEDIFCSMLKSTSNISIRIAESFFSRPENSSKFKKLILSGKLALEAMRQKENELSLEIRIILNQTDEHGIIFEKRFVNILEKENISRDVAIGIFASIPGSNIHHCVSKNNCINYFSHHENEQYLLKLLKNNRHNSELATPPSVGTPKPLFARLNSRRNSQNFVNNNNNNNEGRPRGLSNVDTNSKQHQYLKNQLFKSLSDENNKIYIEKWNSFPWSAANCSAETALQIWESIPKADPNNNMISKSEFDYFYDSQSKIIGPLLFRGYKAIQRMMLTRMKSTELDSVPEQEM